MTITSPTSRSSSFGSGFLNLTRHHFNDGRLLGSNRIEQLPEGIFDSLADLTRLGLSGNEIEQLPNGIFDGLTSLESLYLSYNDIRELPDGAFNSLTGLVRLSLSSNSLTHVPSSVGSLSQLEYLNLFENFHRVAVQ